MTDPGTVSVVVPLYDGARLVSATLTSLERQTAVRRGEVRLEVIVVDDGSGDGGLDVVARHPLPTTVLRQDHLGVAVARNRGAAAASGQWLAFLDQDDLWHESRLERVLPVLREGRAPLVLTSERSFAAEEERELLHRQEPLLAAGVDAWVRAGTELDALCGPEPVIDLTGSGAEEQFTAATMLTRTVSMSTSFFITADHLRLAGGWSPHAASIDDWWLMANAARLAPILKVDQPTLLYRLHARATSRRTSFFYPYATSLLALRLGGQVQGRGDALSTNLHNPTARHLLTQLLYSDEFARVPGSGRFAWHVSHLLWPRGSWARPWFKAWARRTQRRLAGRLARAREDSAARAASP